MAFPVGEALAENANLFNEHNLFIMLAE